MSEAHLPVLGRTVCLRQPTGADELLVLEATGSELERAGLLLPRLTDGLPRQPAQSALDCDCLCVTDMEYLLLQLRQMMFGDRICTDGICPSPGCAARVNVEFRVSDYLAHHIPEQPRHVEPTDKAGWFALRGTPVTFRLPTVADQRAAARTADGVGALIARCVSPQGLPARLLHRVEAALAHLAPSLSHDLQGICAECGASVAFFFDVPLFVMQELRAHAAFVYEDVHRLAARYHWTEADILALPRLRRTRYVELLRAEQGG